MDARRKAALKIANDLINQGSIDAAVKVLADAGASDEAARLLADQGRFVDASRLLLGALGTPIVRLGTLRGQERAWAVMAAQFLARGGNAEGAAEIYVALDDRINAAATLEKAGLVDKAADIRRVAKGVDQLGPASPMESPEIPIPPDASAAEARLNALQGDTAPERYRRNSIEAAHVADHYDILTMQLDGFLAEFIRTGPVNDAEVEAFSHLGALYERQDFPENAREVYRKVVKRDPRNVEIGRRLQNVDRLLARGSDLASIIEEDSAFRGRPADDMKLPDLPPLPGLPGQEPETVQVGGAVVFKPGLVLNDRYKLDEIIGQGGMAIVMRAHDSELEEDVAVKILTQVVMDEDALARFKRELKLSRQLTHPNIIRVHDIGMYANHRYITMELLVGDTLEDLIMGPMDFREGIDMILQACAGLQAAHNQGVIHRDVKPGNFFVTPANHVKVMDFGLARQTDLPSGLTQVGMVAGTPNYISPEQINRPSEVTVSADLYSLGVVMYEMFTGDIPFYHPELMPLLMMHSMQAPVPPTERNPQIPPELEIIILKLMEKQPENRYTSCDELAQHLKVLRYRLGD